MNDVHVTVNGVLVRRNDSRLEDFIEAAEPVANDPDPHRHCKGERPQRPGTLEGWSTSSLSMELLDRKRLRRRVES
jgi:hypothetical protein